MKPRWFLYLLALLLTGGCGSKPPPPTAPTRIVVELAAAADLNPNPLNREHSQKVGLSSRWQNGEKG